MALLVAILLAIFVLPAPWNFVVVIAAAAWEFATNFAAVWWSQRKTAQVGADALLGRVVEVRDPCRPVGTVRVKGEIWSARCDEGASRGEQVSVVGRDGLMLVVRPMS